MTTAQPILDALKNRQQLSDAYSAAPSMAAWSAYNAANNALFPVASATPLSRSEYETLLDGQPLCSDDQIYRHRDTWWSGDDSLFWALIHTARRAGLDIERGRYVAPTDAMLGLELVTEGLPSGFREYQEGANAS
jgi:hypothetical protein